MRPGEESRPAAEAACASWLSGGVLLAFGALAMGSGEGPITLAAADAVAEGWGRWVTFAAGAAGSGYTAVLIDLQENNQDRQHQQHQQEAFEPLSISFGEQSPAQAFELSLTELPELLAACQAALGPGQREELLDFIRSGTTAPGRGSVAMSKSLFAAREALRSRPKPVVIEVDRPQGAAVEVMVAATEKSFYVKGWLYDREAPMTRLTAVAPEGERVELLDGLFRNARPDVDELYRDAPNAPPGEKAGFIAYFELEAPSLLATGWVLEMENEAGTTLEIRVPAAVSDILSARRLILASLPFHALPAEQLMSTKVHPAIEQLQVRAREQLAISSVEDYGDVPESPDVSVVIPLFGRIDFLEHQLAHFTKDEAMQRVELIYVLDSPELDKQLRDSATNLQKLYGVPFRVVTMAHTGGFAGATNAGVSMARGRLLLLLNSDVLPIHPGWLERMRDFYDSKERIGALGVKLLYEDEALQHAGLYFEWVEDTALAGAWANAHYFKGMNRDLPAANETVQVPAVTGACLMISRDLYDQLGGLPEIYVQGDHEDSELCLRLIEIGRENWYLGSVELYHLEGQSYDETFRGMTALYNRWLHSRRWGDMIAKVMSDFRRPDVAESIGAKSTGAQNTGEGRGEGEHAVVELPAPR